MAALILNVYVLQLLKVVQVNIQEEERSIVYIAKIIYLLKKDPPLLTSADQTNVGVLLDQPCRRFLRPMCPHYRVTN